MHTPLLPRTLAPLALATTLGVGCAPTAPAVAPPGITGTAPASTHASHGPLVHRFKDAAAWAEVFDDPSRDTWQKPDEVVRLLATSPGMIVADVGAGTGYFEPYLSRAVGPSGQVLALDVEAGMIAWMRDRAARDGLANVKPAQIPYDDPKLPPGKIDRVLVVDTWHHIPERASYAAKLRSALAPGGLVMVVDFDLDAKQGPPREHRLAPQAVAGELASAGLVAEAVPETLPDQYVVVGRLPDAR